MPPQEGCAPTGGRGQAHSRAGWDMREPETAGDTPMRKRLYFGMEIPFLKEKIPPLLTPVLFRCLGEGSPACVVRPTEQAKFDELDWEAGETPFTTGVLGVAPQPSYIS